jgi:hypothetical protein
MVVGRLLNVLAILSLLLCLAMAALWVFSSLKVFHLRYNRSPPANETYAYYLGFKSYGGTVSAEVHRRHFPASYFGRLTGSELSDFRKAYPPGLDWSVAGGKQTIFYSPEPRGFRFHHGVYPQAAGWRSEYGLLAVPLWLPMVLSLVLPVVRLQRIVAARRIERPGLCPSCGYDLQATPERCPECGTMVPAGGWRDVRVEHNIHVRLAKSRC